MTACPRISVALAVIVSLLPRSACAFQRPHLYRRSQQMDPPKHALVRRDMGPRYGPSSEDLVNNNKGDDSKVVDVEQEEWERSEAARVSRQQVEFRDLIQKVMSATNPQFAPSIMTKHMDLLLTMRGYEGSALIEDALKEASEKGEDHAEQVADAIEFILSFVEAFVDQAQTLDDVNKQLLGRIIKTMTTKATTARDREDLLDDLMEREKENFSAGFLRHIEGECERITAAPIMTPESSRLLEILRIIQARVLEELGKDIGEEALVLGQLLGYDNAKERMAVLEVGLTVRGIDFAKGMVALTEEALNGLSRVAGGADPDLVERVSEIDARLRMYMERQSSLQ